MNEYNNWLGIFEGKNRRKKEEQLKMAAGGDIDFNAIINAAKAVNETNKPGNSNMIYVVIGLIVLGIAGYFIYKFLKK